jgi:hypothetical protein
MRGVNGETKTVLGGTFFILGTIFVPEGTFFVLRTIFVPEGMFLVIGTIFVFEERWGNATRQDRDQQAS